MKGSPHLKETHTSLIGVFTLRSEILNTISGKEEDGLKKFWQARGRGGTEAREEEKGGSNQQAGSLTVGLGKRKIKGRKNTNFN